jgi:type II secretory pathway component PulK
VFNQQSRIANRRSERGFAILMVVLVLVGLIIIGAPFAISMRQEEKTSVNFAARIRARLAAQSALTWAVAQLERSHEHWEQLWAESPPGSQSEAIFNSPQVDENGEFGIDLLSQDLGGVETANPTGVMWGATATDEQGKVNIKTAPEPLLVNLLNQLSLDGIPEGIAQAIVNYRTDGGDSAARQFTTLTQLRDLGGVSAADYDLMARYLTVHSASLVGEVSGASQAPHPVNINACTEEVLRALFRDVRLAPQDDEETNHAGVTWAEADELVRRLHVFTGLASAASAGASSVALEDASGLPPQGWVSIDGDVVKYTGISGNSLTGIPTDPASTNDPPCAGVDADHPREDRALSEVRVRLLITDVATDLARILDDAVEAGRLREQSRSAILANAINPRDPVLVQNTTTAPLCFRSFNIYTVEATGVVNGADGRELARYTIRQVAQVAPVGDLEIRIDTQADFEASRQAGIAHHVATWPEPVQVSDIPPSNEEPTDEQVSATPRLMFRRGRLGLEPAEYTPAGGTTFVARYNGPLTTNTLRAEDATTRMPAPVQLDGFTTVKCKAGEDGDIEPEGVRVGARDTDDDGTPDEKRILVYPARNDEDLGQSNIPHGGEYIQPFIIEMWVKFDPKDQFDYGKDHFLFDLAEDTYTNRVALYYDSTSDSGGDLVLHVCDATNQPLPAQVRYAITEDTFEPQRWYHLAAVVKGLNYNQLALLIDGKSRGRYEPSGALSSNLDVAGTSAQCQDSPPGQSLAVYTDDEYFARFAWPQEDCVVVGGELMEYTSAGLTSIGINADGRGSRGTQARNHWAGTRVEIYGYDDQLRKGSYHWSDTEFPQSVQTLLTQSLCPQLSCEVPEDMPEAEVTDGDEQTPEGTTFENQPATTAEGTAQFQNPTTDQYQAADIEGNTLPTDTWLPVSYSTMWIVEAMQDPADDETRFNQAAGTEDGGLPEDRILNGFLACDIGDTVLSRTQRTIEDPNDGLGFIRVIENQAEGEDDNAGEMIKFSKVGVLLVWRWHPDDEDDPETEGDDRRKIAWYIGYLAGLGTEDGAETHQRRGCFGTEVHEIFEGARIRFDALRLHNTQPELLLARGHQEEVRTEIEQPGGEVVVNVGKRNGRGIFQLYRPGVTNYYEWVQFTFPQYEPEEEETALLANPGTATQWLVDITRSAMGTGPADNAGHTKGYPFQGSAALGGGGDQVMPVYFTHNTVRVMNHYLPVVKGSGDKVTLTDLTGQRERHVVAHGSGHYFAFRDYVAGNFAYAAEPRVLKFPSGNLPTRPDKLFYVGSDAVCRDGETGEPFTEGGSDTTDEPAGEPERPANAVFDEIKIYEASHYSAAALYDWQSNTPGTSKNTRWTPFAPDSDAAPIEAGLSPPFTIRIGHLERISPSPGEPTEENPNPFNQPFRFVAGGDANLPQEGYLKVDDECMFYRTLYRNRHGSRSATVVLPSSTTYDENGLAIALSDTGNEIYVEAEDENGNPRGDAFPEQGYITIHNSWPSPTYWQRLGTLSTQTGLSPAIILQWLRETGNPLLNEGGGHLSSGSSYSAPERIFYTSKERTTLDGKPVVKLTLANRGILDSSAHEVKFVDPDNKPSWFVEDETSMGGATVRVFSVELVVLKRACLGTTADRHAVGTIVLPLEHIPTSLAPRPLVKLRRDLETGELERDPEDESLVRALDDSAEFDITQPEDEYGLVVEDADNFPPEGYVQVGDEILAYNAIHQASVPMRDAAQNTWVRKHMPVLTGIKHFRQRFGTARAPFLDFPPSNGEALESLDPGVPDPAYEPGDSNYQIQHTPPYWTDNENHIVRLREFRYHDRFPQREPTGLLTSDYAPGGEADYVGEYSPHPDETQLGYYEFAVTLPGARWTRIQWREMLYRPEDGLGTEPLGEDDPFDVKVLVQIDGAPGWDDMTLDAAAEVNDQDVDPDPFVSTPVHWTEFPNRDDAYTAEGYRPRKPVIWLFDEPTAENYINPLRGSTSTPQARGQNGDRIRLRVFFQYRNGEYAAPSYDIPWRSPFVDTIRLHYRAPTYVMEHREMSY